MKTVAIIGGGISGLAAAYRLLMRSKKEKFPLSVVILEASDRVGGALKSMPQADYFLEEGADSFITNKVSAKNLAIDLGLEDALIETNTAHRRSLIAMKDRLVPLPEGFLMVAPTRLFSFLATPLLSVAGKIRTLMEYFLPAGNPTGRDESVAQFITRRFGRELFERVAQAMVGGIYTGDCSRLSAKSTLEKFVRLETKCGSVIKGLLEENNQTTSQASGARYAIFNSLTEGVEMLVDALMQVIGADQVKLSSRVTSVSRNGSTWAVEIQTAQDKLSTLEVDAVVLACPAKIVGEILTKSNAGLALKLKKIQSTSSIVFNFLFDDADIAKPFDGFGFVVPEIENKKILACAAISTKYVKRAPANHTVLRVFIGGELGKDLLDLDDNDLKIIALSELSYYVKLKGDPLKTWVRRWPGSMPQYEIGHEELIKAIEQDLAQLEGIALCGNSYHGVGIPDCILSGERAADQTLETLQKHDLLR